MCRNNLAVAAQSISTQANNLVADIGRIMKVKIQAIACRDYMSPGSQGFTLIELIITLSIAAILVTMAVPSFSTIIKDNRQITQANDVITTLTFARSEAIKRGARVVVCKSSNGASCVTSGGWDQGWITFVDANNDAAVTLGEELLRVHGSLATGTTLKGDANVSNYISYVARGNSQLITGAIQPGILVECDDRGFGAKAQAITISATGRAKNWPAADAGATSCAP